MLDESVILGKWEHAGLACFSIPDLPSCTHRIFSMLVQSQVLFYLLYCRSKSI